MNRKSNQRKPLTNAQRLNLMEDMMQDVLPATRNQASKQLRLAKQRKQRQAKGGVPRNSMLMGGDIGAVQIRSATGDQCRVTLSGASSVYNTATTPFPAAYYFTLDFNALTGIPILTSNATAFASLWRHFVIHSVTVRIIPTTAATSGGFLACGWDSSPLAVNPTVVGQITDHPEHVIVPVSQVGEFSVASKSLGTLRKLVSTTTVTDYESFGVLQVFGSNSAGSAANVGILEIALDVSFYGLA